MTTDIQVPSLGESVTEATIARWYKKIGDSVTIDEPLLELETDKVTLEVPAPATGQLTDIKVNDGDTVEVGAVLGSIVEGQAPVETKPEISPQPEPIEIKEEIQAIEVAKGQVRSAESSLSIITNRLKNLRSLQINLPSHMDTSESGANDKEIAVQTSSVKQLKKIAGANSASKGAIDELDPIIKQMDDLLADMRVETVQSKFDAQKTNFAELAALIPDLVNHTPRFSDPNSGENINLLKPSGGVIDAGQPNTYEAKKLDYAYQSGSLGNNPITVQSGTLGSNPFTVQSGTLGSNPFTVQSGTLGSNPFTIKGGDLPANPWRWFADHTPARDSDDTAILKLRIEDHGLQAGDKITVSGTSNAFGADLNGTYTVHSVRNSAVIHIDVGVDLGSPPATNENGGGSSGTFATNRVQVNHAGHPFSNGNTVTFSGASSVGGQSLNGSFTIENQSTNSYEFLLGSPGSAAATGGGGSVAVNASDQVTIAHTGHKFAIGDHVTLSNTSAVGGLSLDGTFEITNIAENSYTITFESKGQAANGGGNTVGYGHSLDNNPFTTSNGSPDVTVTHKGHGLSVGDVITYSNSSAVGGLDLNKTFRVSGVSNSDTYTITAQSNATSAVSGGGASVGFIPNELSSIVDSVATSVSVCLLYTSPSPRD